MLGKVFVTIHNFMLSFQWTMHIILALCTLWYLCTLLRLLQRNREDGSYRSSLLDWLGEFWYVLISWFTNCVWVLANVIRVVFNLNTCLVLICSQVGFVVNLVCQQFIFGWRISLSLEILIGAILAFGMIFLPETPRYIATYQCN